MVLAGVDVADIPTWISAGGIVGGLGILLNFILRNKSGDREGGGSLFRGLQTRVETLERECAALRVEVTECRRREGEWMHRAIVAEAALMGKGEAHQEAQRIVSTEREADAIKRKGKSDG